MWVSAPYDIALTSFPAKNTFSQRYSEDEIRGVLGPLDQGVLEGSDMARFKGFGEDGWDEGD